MAYEAAAAAASAAMAGEGEGGGGGEGVPAPLLGHSWHMLRLSPLHAFDGGAASLGRYRQALGAVLQVASRRGAKADGRGAVSGGGGAP